MFNLIQSKANNVLVEWTSEKRHSSHHLLEAYFSLLLLNCSGKLFGK